MGLFGRRQTRDEGGASSNASVVGLYGKHPGAGDFLRVNASSLAVRAFDEWLSGALTVAQRQSGWNGAYVDGDTLSFLFLHPAKGSGGALLGSMVPSRDRSGRQFPLVIFAELELELAVREQPWLATCRFLEEAVEILARRENLDRDELLAAVEDLTPPGPDAFDEGRRRLSRIQETVLCGAAFRNMFGADGKAERALVALEEACRVTGNYAILCPLGSIPAAGDVALWLLILQALATDRLMPGMLWSGSALLLFLARWSQRALLPLWKPGPAFDDIYDLRNLPPGASRPIPADQPLVEWLAGLR